MGQVTWVGYFMVLLAFVSFFSRLGNGAWVIGVGSIGFLILALDLALRVWRLAARRSPLEDE